MYYMTNNKNSLHITYSIPEHSYIPINTIQKYYSSMKNLVHFISNFNTSLTVCLIIIHTTPSPFS